jgi:hypothetical protein
MSTADLHRHSLAEKASLRPQKALLAQFFTPPSVARFMAGLFCRSDRTVARVLDAGAGTGALSVAFLHRWRTGGFAFRDVDLHAFEVDARLRPGLEAALGSVRPEPGLTTTVWGEDFIDVAARSISGDLFSEALPSYTHAILNPPYKKMSSRSRHRTALRRCGIETVNLYSGFVALSLALLEPGGELVAITPRSFCNGPYYRPFRSFLLSRAAIRQMHLFGSRDRTFRQDDVLQENVIIRLERGGEPCDVTISTSTDDSFADLEERVYPFDRIVLPDDDERFIHIPTTPGRSAVEVSGSVHHSLDSVGLKVSTGPVVDFRLRPHLRDLAERGTVPLVYPSHCRNQRIEWPQPGGRKPNAILRNSETERWLYPVGFYCVVRRFSSKEERRRIVASLVRPDDFDGAEMLGFENDLNVFHQSRRGLPPDLARGLVAYLNSTAVDEHFRRFSGHTQVNATDLRAIQYPSRDALTVLGRRSAEDAMTQREIDRRVQKVIA